MANHSFRFLFICGGLEPGKDGIGDYARRLASGLAAYGHRSLLISFGDEYAPEKTLDSAQGEEVDGITICRFRGSLVEHMVFETANTILNNFSPSLISVQYNPYSFNPKGVPFRFLFALKRLANNLPVHIVFHELWAFFAFPIPLRSKFYAPFQKQAVLFLMRELNVVSSYTSNEFYQNMLSSLGIASSLSPVFSNIRIASSNRLDSAKFPPLPEAVFSNYAAKIGIFGNQVGKFSNSKFNQLIDKIGILNGQVLLIVIGNQTKRTNSFVDKVVSMMPCTTHLYYSGFLSERYISILLQEIDFALTTYPYELAGKSGALAAVCEHGKPIFFVGIDLDNRPDLRCIDDSLWQSFARLDHAVRQIESVASNLRIP